MVDSTVPQTGPAVAYDRERGVYLVYVDGTQAAWELEYDDAVTTAQRLYWERLERSIYALRFAPQDAPDVRGWQFVTTHTHAVEGQDEVYIPDDASEPAVIYLRSVGIDVPIELGAFVRVFTALHALVIQTQGFVQRVNG